MVARLATVFLRERIADMSIILCGLQKENLGKILATRGDPERFYRHAIYRGWA